MLYAYDWKKKEDVQARAKKIWKKIRENTWFDRFSRA